MDEVDAAPHRRAAPSDHRWPWLLVAVGLAAAAWVWPALQGRVYVLDDLANWHLPWRWFYAQCLHQGWDFVWTPQVFNGFYLHGEGQAGLYHPLHWLLYRWLPLTLAFNLECLINLPLLGAGMYLLLRRHALTREGALVGAFGAASCGFCMLHFVHVNLLAVLAHAPWALWCLDHLLRDRWPTAWWAAPGLALLTASQALLGFPQLAWYSALIEGLYVLTLLIRQPRQMWREAALAAVAKALGVLIGAIQLLPTWGTVRESWRVALDPTIYNVQSLPPLNLVQWWSPYLLDQRIYPTRDALTHEYGFYAGAGVLLLSLWALWRAREFRQRAVFWFAVGLVGVGLVLTLGRYGGVNTLLGQLPLIGKFKSPCRYMVLLQFGLAILAGLAVVDLRTSATVPFRWSGVALFCAVPALSVLTVLVLPLTAVPLAASTAAHWAGPLLTLTATALLLAAWRRVPGALSLLLIFAVADLTYYGLSYVRRSPPLTIPGLLEHRLSVPPDVRGRVLSSDNLFVMQGMSVVDGYMAFRPQRQVRPRSRPQWRLLGVHWVHSSNLPGYQQLPAHWRPLDDPVPRVRLLTRAVPPTASIEDQLRDVDFTTTAIADHPEALGLDGSAPGTAVMAFDEPGHFRVLTRTASRQLLVITERWHPGWRVTGAAETPPAPFPVYGDLLGCVVPPGEHEVTFTFAPRDLAIGQRISVIGLALLALGSLVGWWTSRRHRRSELSYCVISE